MAGVMITNGGSHPPEKVAITCAEQLFQIDRGAITDPERLMMAEDLLLAIKKALIPHHRRVQATERGTLKSRGTDHLDAPIDPLADAKLAFADIRKAAKGTPWEDHFDDPAVEHEVIQTIGNHMATDQHIERQWHCHRNPDDKRAQAWLGRWHPKTPLAPAAS